ncbi:MAG: amidohydrolase family protein [Thermoanaerobaculia bacterium]
MLVLIRNGEIYEPEPQGTKDVLLCAGKIALLGNAGEIDPRGAEALGLEIDVIDAEGCLVTPGFIDPHTHLTGGSGEEGFASRTPELQLSEIVPCGITTVVGCLGLDATTRTLEGLVAKVRGLGEEGITAFMYTGHYGIPPSTLTGSVRGDLILIGEVLGVGEIAVSDHRAPQPDARELARVVIDAQAGGMLSGKAGVTHFHLGEDPDRLAPLRALLDEHRVRPELLYAAHIHRTPELLEEAIELSKRGVYMDMDAAQDIGEPVRRYCTAGGDPERLTLSSDADGNAPWRLHDQLRAARDQGLPLEKLLALVTSNPAKVLKLETKGRLEPGRDADVLVLRRESLEVVHVIANGRFLVRDGRLQVREKFLETSRRSLELRGKESKEGFG